MLVYDLSGMTCVDIVVDTALYSQNTSSLISYMITIALLGPTLKMYRILWLCVLPGWKMNVNLNKM